MSSTRILTWTLGHEYSENKGSAYLDDVIIKSNSQQDGTVKKIAQDDIKDVFHFALLNGLKTTQTEPSRWIVSFPGKTAEYTNVVIKDNSANRP
jgi:hypothetical protein